MKTVQGVDFDPTTGRKWKGCSVGRGPRRVSDAEQDPVLALLPGWAPPVLSRGDSETQSFPSPDRSVAAEPLSGRELQHGMQAIRLGLMGEV